MRDELYQLRMRYRAYDWRSKMPWNQTMGKIIDALREKIEKKEPNRRISRISQELEEYLRPETKKKDR
jgi:arginyl-tRNA synthetase